MAERSDGMSSDQGEKITPIFLFSLPRAGSTLLQRMLATQSGIATAAEPWVLIPFLYAFRNEGIEAEYRQETLSAALEGFLLSLPNEKRDYYDHLRDFTMRLYRTAAGPEATYFLDKTPRYGLVAEEIIEMFGQRAKYVFLWRQPLAVAASMTKTWARDTWRLRSRRIDLHKSLDGLINAHRKYSDLALSVRFEDLVSDPEAIVGRLAEYLDIPFVREQLGEFTQVSKQFKGTMTGDPTGQQAYKKVDSRPLEKWKASYCNPLRKRWARRYLKWLGQERAETMGYDLAELQSQLAECSVSTRRLLVDLLFGSYEAIFSKRARIRIRKCLGLDQPSFGDDVRDSRGS
jgi:sulfotransferase family protein